MLQMKLVTHLYGNASLMLWQPAQIVTKFDFAAGTYTQVNHKAVLAAVAAGCGQQMMPPQHFTDSCIIAGWTTFPTFLPIQQGVEGGFSLPKVFQACHQFQGGFKLLQYFMQLPGAVSTPFQRHFNAISTPFQRHFNAISTPFP